jgi:hypothetical protein
MEKALLWDEMEIGHRGVPRYPNINKLYFSYFYKI